MVAAVAAAAQAEGGAETTTTEDATTSGVIGTGASTLHGVEIDAMGNGVMRAMAAAAAAAAKAGGTTSLGASQPTAGVARAVAQSRGGAPAHRNKLPAHGREGPEGPTTATAAPTRRTKLGATA